MAKSGLTVEVGFKTFKTNPSLPLGVNENALNGTWNGRLMDLVEVTVVSNSPSSSSPITVLSVWKVSALPFNLMVSFFSHFRYEVPFDFDPITVLAKFNEINNDFAIYLTKPAGALDPNKVKTRNPSLRSS